MARHEHQPHRLRRRRRQRLQQEGLLVVVRAAGDEHGLPRRGEPRAQPRAGVAVVAHRHAVVLHVAGDGDARRIDAEVQQALLVGLVLHAVPRDEVELRQQPAQQAVATEGLLADAAVDDRDRDVALARGLQEVGPDLQLHQQHAARPHPAERARREAGEVERVEHDRQVGMLLARDEVAVGRRRRQHDLQVGTFLPDARDQVVRRLDLADRHPVDPHHRLVAAQARHEAHALARARALLRVGEPAPEQHRAPAQEAEQEERLVDRHGQPAARPAARQRQVAAAAGCATCRHDGSCPRPRGSPAGRAEGGKGARARTPAINRTRARSTSCT